MADDSTPAQERTERATPHRRRKALEEGRVPRSTELSAAGLLLAGALGVGVLGGPVLAGHARALLLGATAALAAGPLSVLGAETLLRGVAQRTLLALLPLLVVLLATALLINGVQSRGVLSAKPITPKLSHLNPLKGVKRLVSAQAAFTLLKALAKLAVVGSAIYLVLAAAWPDLVALGTASVDAVAVVLRSVALKLALLSGLAFLGVAGADYAFQVYQYEKQLRMTRQEVVQERKEQDGDPLVKSRMQSVARALARRRMLGQVRTADVVVTNPTHIAVALKYDVAAVAAPVVVAMGERKLAERIKAIAREAGVPCVENRVLARALLATGKVGRVIPPALYAAVAEVLAHVYRRRLRLTAPGGTA